MSLPVVDALRLWPLCMGATLPSIDGISVNWTFLKDGLPSDKILQINFLHFVTSIDLSYIFSLPSFSERYVIRYTSLFPNDRASLSKRNRVDFRLVSWDLVSAF